MSKNSIGQRLCDNKKMSVKYTSSKSQKQRDKEIKEKLKEMKKNKLQTIIIILVVILAIVFIVFLSSLIKNNTKIELADDTILTTLDVERYNQEILALYNREGQLELFEKEMNRIQQEIGTYIIENMTVSDGEFKTLKSNINKELKKDTWSNIVTNKSTYYIGEYSIDENGNLKFKFDSKAIEPTWINNESIKKYIILN